MHPAQEMNRGWGAKEHVYGSNQDKRIRVDRPELKEGRCDKLIRADRFLRHSPGLGEQVSAGLRNERAYSRTLGQHGNSHSESFQHPCGLLHFRGTGDHHCIGGRLFPKVLMEAVFTVHGCDDSELQGKGTIRGVSEPALLVPIKVSELQMLPR